MTIGDPIPEEPRRFERTYELIYEVSDRARALAPGIAGIMRGVVVVLTIPAIFLIVSAIFPIAGVGLIAQGASGWVQLLLFVLAAIALIIEILFARLTWQYTRAIRAPEFVPQVAQLVDIADLSDELLDRLRGTANQGRGAKRLQRLWALWRTPSFLTDRIKNLRHVRLFVPPYINFNIRLTVIQFWMVVFMWGLLVITIIARLSGTL